MPRFGPAGMVLRVRWLFLLLNLLVAIVTLLAIPGSVGSRADQAFAMLAVTAIIAWSVHRYRFSKVWPILDLVPVVAVVLLGISAASPDAAFGPTFALVCYRAQFGNWSEVLANAIAFVAAFLLPYLVLADGVGETSVLESVLVLGFLLVVAKVMHGFMMSARRHEAALAREQLFAGGSATLLAADSEEQILGEALRTLTGLSSERVQVTCMRTDAAGGLDPGAVDDRFRSHEAWAWLASAPETLERELRAGKPLHRTPPPRSGNLARVRRAQHREQIAALPIVIGEVPMAIAVVVAADPCDLDEVVTPAARFVDEVRLVVERARLHEELRSASASKDLFLSMVSHELRTPLTVVRGAFETLHAHGDSMTREARTELMDLGLRQAVRQQRLIDDLLLTTRLGAGRLPVRPDEVDLAAVVDEVARALELGEQLEIDVEAGANLSAWVDPVHVAQIVTNLLTNATKYGAPPIEVTARTRDADVLLRVRDHGAGISGDDTSRVFDPFEQVLPAEQPSAGVGLGLAIARRLALANGGDLGIRPVSGPGACFQLRLPGRAPPVAGTGGQ